MEKLKKAHQGMIGGQGHYVSNPEEEVAAFQSAIIRKNIHLFILSLSSLSFLLFFLLFRLFSPLHYLSASDFMSNLIDSTYIMLISEVSLNNV